MKYILIAALLLGATLTVNAQEEGFHTVGAGAELALPMGDFSQVYGVGFGATGKVFYGISEAADITGTLGYLHFGMKEEHAMMSGHMGMVPIMFGYRHDFGGFYVEPQLGLTVISSKITMDGMDLGFMESGSSSTTKLGLGLGGGHRFGNWDLGLRFQLVDNLNFIGARIGYNFPL